MMKFNLNKSHINSYCRDLKSSIVNQLKEKESIEILTMYNPSYEMFFYCTPILLLDMEKQGNVFYSSNEFKSGDKITINGLKQLIFDI